MLYTVAILKKNEDIQLITLRSESIFHDDRIKEVEALQNDGYVLDRAIITTSREQYYSALLQGRCMEYVSYLKYSKLILDKTRKDFGVDSEVFLQTLDMTNEYIRVLKIQIARDAERCLALGQSISDLAQECVFERHCDILRSEGK